jgi:hypothetical protein
MVAKAGIWQSGIKISDASCEHCELMDITDSSLHRHAAPSEIDHENLNYFFATA